MRKTEKKQYSIVLLLVIFAVLIGLIIPSHRLKLNVSYPHENTTLTEQDFLIETNNGTLQIGCSSFDEVIALLPEGKILGMSTIYKPDNLDCLFTFTEDEDILHRIHINTPALSTSRGIKVGEPFARAIKIYGSNYAKVNLLNESDDFDAVYGTDDNIIFQVRKNNITKIIIEKSMST
jgi:hypothetical protein